VRLFIREDWNFNLMLGSHDSVPTHDMLVFWEVLAREFITKLDQPYSSDLALCKFWVFPELETALKSHRFSDIVNIQGH
jgi:hypothetical protein